MRKVRYETKQSGTKNIELPPITVFSLQTKKITYLNQQLSFAYSIRVPRLEKEGAPDREVKILFMQDIL